MHEKAQKLREERAALVKEAQAILTNEELTAEERHAKFDEMMDKADELKAEINRLERAIEAERELEERRELRALENGVSVDEQNENDERELEAFNTYVRFGMVALTDEQREFLAGRHEDLDPKIRAAMSVGTDAAGGYTVPEGFARRLEEALKAYGGMLEVSEVIETSTGAKLPFPTENDTANKGAIIDENTQITAEQDLAFGQVSLEAYMYHSKIVKVSLQLLQDSAFDIDGLLARKLGTRIARIWNEHFTTGTGTNEPNGVITAATLGKTTASGTAITWPEMVDLEHSVDPEYRRNARWMFHDQTLAALKKLLDGNDRPLWQAGIAVGEPDRLGGYPYVINQDMATIALSAKTVAFGNLNKYLVRRVLGFQLMRLTERFADFLQVGFLGYARADGDLIDAGTNPVKYLQQAAE
jgi:HK97 family phage major capsid protein